jgi:hypothetical protein
MNRSTLVRTTLVLAALAFQVGCINLNVGLMPANDAPTCAACDAEVQRAAYLQQIQRSGFLATRDSALEMPTETLSTELK